MSYSRRHSICLFPLVLALALPVAFGMEPEILTSELEASTLDPGAVRLVKPIRIEAGIASISLQGGLLFPATSVGGEVRELVFLGAGSIALDPPNDLEARQLEVFTGSRKLDESFHSAVFVVTNDGALAALMGFPSAAGVHEAQVEIARELYAAWKDGPERKGLDIPSAILSDALEPHTYDRYFAAMFRGATLGDFLYEVQPDELEQIALVQFVPMDATKWELRQEGNSIRREQRRGRLRDLEPSDLGEWDFWVSSAYPGEPEGHPGFSPSHYDLEIDLTHGRLNLTGKAKMTIEANLGGRRLIRLEMSSDLAMERVSLGDAREELFFVQQGGRSLVLLPEAPAAGTRFELHAEYRGRVIEKAGRASYALRSTSGWYPTIGDLPRATFDVTYRWPSGLDLVSSGNRVDGGKGNGVAWERRKIEIPVLGFTFELGKFRTITAQAGHVKVNVVFDADTDILKEISRDEVVETVTGALEYYEETFGPYPLDTMTVVTVPRDFSQGMLSLLTLASSVLSVPEEFRDFFEISDPRTIIAHEIAHQWWGNIIGWKSYRDQWISEAMANFSAVMYASDRMDWKHRPRIVPTGGWRSAVGRTARRGMPVDDIGPVVMGTRLHSSLDDNAYSPIVYKKGAIVLNMISQTFRNTSDFVAILKELVRERGNSTISTEDFIDFFKQRTGVDFDPIAERFVYGTGLPDVFYDYAIERSGDGWVVKGVAEQIAPYSTKYGLRETPQGTLDLIESRVDRNEVAGSIFVAPVQVILDRKQENGSLAGVDVRLILRGERTEFELPFEHRPLSMKFDPQNGTYCSFHGKQEAPKRALTYRGRYLAVSGQLDEAERLFRKALNAEISSDKGRTAEERASRKFEGRLLDRLIHLELARIELQRDRIDEAEALYKKAFSSRPDLARHLRMDLDVLRARLDLRQGRPLKAYERLERALFGIKRAYDSEAIVVLAIAAKLTGNTEMYRTARKEAARFGADLSLLSRNQD